MKIIKNKACFTIDNCNFMGIENFRKEFSTSEKCKNLTKDIQEMNIIVKVNGIEVKDFNVMPLIVYGNEKIQISYDDLNNQISIETNEYDTQKELMISLLKVLSQFKIQDTTYITFKFSSDCDNGENKLRIFTQNMDNFPYWVYNEGFEVKIPISVPDTKYTETYTISKVKGGDRDNIFDNYVYRVIGNYKYKIEEDKANLESRLSLVSDIINSIADLYTKFEKVCTKTMEL